MKSNSKNRVVIVDDPILFSQSLKLLINSFEDFEVVNSFENGKEFVSYLKENPKPPIDLILQDLNMPILDGLNTLKTSQISMLSPFLSMMMKK